MSQSQYFHELPRSHGERRPKPRNGIERKVKAEHAKRAADAARIPSPHLTEIRVSKFGTKLPCQITRPVKGKRVRKFSNGGSTQPKQLKPVRVPFKTRPSKKAWVRALGSTQAMPAPVVTRQQRRHAEQKARHTVSA